LGEKIKRDRDPLYGVLAAAVMKTEHSINDVIHGEMQHSGSLLPPEE
jgi:hypothetical protein